MEAGLIGGLSGLAMGGGVYAKAAVDSGKTKVGNALGTTAQTKNYKNALITGDEYIQKLAEQNADADVFGKYKEAFELNAENQTKESQKKLEKRQKKPPEVLCREQRVRLIRRLTLRFIMK